MSNEQDDKLFGELFGDEPKTPPAKPAAQAKPAQAARPAQPAAPSGQAVRKPAPQQAQAQTAPRQPEPVPALPPEEVAREAAQLFSEMMADNRRAEADAAAKKAAAKAAEPPPESHELIYRPVAPVEEKPRSQFSESVAPWTLFKGFSAITMLVYIVGFHGQKLADSWVTLFVLGAAVTVAVLLVDYVRYAPRVEKEPTKKGK
jgi:hypothetical protein